MKRMLTVMVGVVTIVAFTSLPVLSTEAADLVGELELRGYFIEGGSDVDFDDFERLASEWPDVYFVVLARDPSAGSDLMASEALSSLGLEGTVIVVAPGEIGVRSTIYSDDDIDRALDAAFDLFDTSYYDGFAAFAGALDSVEATESSSGGGGFIFLLIIVGIGLLIWWAIRRSNRNREGTFQTRIDEVKAEIQGQLSEAANDILELEDDILLSDNQDAKELYYSGSAGYAQFQEQLAGATSLAQLDHLAEGADLALWQLEAAEALLDGEAPPPRPKARPDFEPPAPPPSSQVRHPELPEELQLRRDRRDVRVCGPASDRARALEDLVLRQ